MSSTSAAADTSRKRTLRSWTSAAASGDECTATAAAADPPAASAAAAASGSRGDIYGGDINSMFSEAQMGVVKQLPNLRRLTLRECEYSHWFDAEDHDDTRWLRSLCPLPHRLQRLTRLDLSQHRLRLDHVQLLLQLPALRILAPAAVYESALPLLPSFADRLHRLKLRVEIFDEEIEIDPELFDVDTQMVRASFFLPHLTPCSQLTHLILCDCAFSEGEAETLCRAFPELKVLGLQKVGWPSFESLRHLPLLESLRLQRARTHPLHIKAAHFRPQQLRHLSLWNLPPLSDAAQGVIDALRPPSALLPALTRFTYLPPSR